jgi:DNA-binding transcriptional MerR regulator
LKSSGPELRIGEVAERAGVATSTIRFYESIGLLPEPDRESGQRRYGDEVLGTLRFIAAAQDAGLTLREIGELMQGQIAGALRDVSSRKLPEVQALIARAERSRVWLEMAAECACETQEECALFDEGAPVARDGCRRVTA